MNNMVIHNLQWETLRCGLGPVMKKLVMKFFHEKDYIFYLKKMFCLITNYFSEKKLLDNDSLITAKFYIPQTGHTSAKTTTA